jgi:hypothetical protein
LVCDSISRARLGRCFGYRASEKLFLFTDPFIVSLKVIDIDGKAAVHFLKEPICAEASNL